jgi:ubiquinone/menaquinone biosynthesis C-methylase UbiE
MVSLDDVYAHLWTAHGDEYAMLDRSQRPRSWELLFDIAAQAGLGRGATVLDAGCGRGHHCFELAGRFECRAIGLDLVLPPLKAALAAPERTADVSFVQGSIDQLPIRTGSVDFVWCRDMLVHIASVECAARECFRVLRRGGNMLAWVTFETELMEPREAERIYAPLEIASGSMCRLTVEQSFANAGFDTLQVEELGSELIQFYEERDGRVSRELMRIARMQRLKAECIRQWGESRYAALNAVYHWMVYHALGKLSSAYYLLQKPP